jgi:hypothetical protein
MKIVHWSLDWIKPYENNPRANDATVDAVARSIEQFGFRQPIVVDEEGVIICGQAASGADEERQDGNPFGAVRVRVGAGESGRPITRSGPSAARRC